MNKLLLLGSVVSPCPPLLQGGTERVAYYQAKQLAKRGVPLLFVGAPGTVDNFSKQLEIEHEEQSSTILKAIEFIEIGGGTAHGNQEDKKIMNPSQTEASRLLRLEMVHLAQVLSLMDDRRNDYAAILTNMRGEAVFLSTARMLGKPIIPVMHLNVFAELASLFQKYQTPIITISHAQQTSFPSLSYLDTIYNPVHIESLPYNPTPRNYALMMGTIGFHKNQKDAITACKLAGMPLILAGKIRDQDYFNREIKPHIDGKTVTYHGELEFGVKLKLYREARVFLFPVTWQEPFGLVLIEALACGTPVIAYPHGGPAEIVQEGVTGFLVRSPEQIAEKIGLLNTIDRSACRKDAQERFSDHIIGEQYYTTLIPFLNHE